MAVLIKRSSVAGKVPTTASMNLGELAMNTYDGRLFMMANNGSGNQIVEITSATSLANITVSGNMTLTAAQYSCAMIVFSGALSANTVITVPDTPHSFIVVNKTTGSYSLTIQATGQTPSVVVTQGTAESLLCDTTGVYATAATTGVEFAKIIPVSGSITADITYAGALLVVTTAGVTITMPHANTYQGGTGFGILNISGGNITIALQSGDGGELTFPLTSKNNDSYYLASDNATKWHCVWYSNPQSPTFGALTAASSHITGNEQVDGTLTATGAATLNGGLGVTGTTNLNGVLNITAAGPTINFNAGGPQLSVPATNTLAISNGVAEAFRVAANQHVLVGTTTDDGSNLQVSGDVSSQQGKFVSTRYAANGGAIVVRNAAGTFALPTATQSGFQTGTLTYRSYDGANYQDNASIDAWTDAATSSSNSSANLRFYTTASGSINKTERMRILSSGRILVNQTSDDGASILQVTGVSTFNGAVAVGGAITATGIVTGTNSAGALIASNGSGAGQTSIELKRVGAATDQKTWEVIQDGSGTFGVRTVNDAYTASQYAMQVTRASSYNLGYMSLMPAGGNVLIDSTTDNGVDKLQVTGSVQSTVGFRFPDGTLQTTANGVTAPTSNVYTPAAAATSIQPTGGYTVGFVQVFKNNDRLIPNIDFTANDGINVNLTVAATGRDRYEVLTSIIYSPSTVFQPTSQVFNLTVGATTITTTYLNSIIWVFQNNDRLIPGVDFTANTTTGVITLTVAATSATDNYEVITFTPFAVNGMLPFSQNGSLSLAQGQVVSYSGTGGKWQNYTLALGATFNTTLDPANKSATVTLSNTNTTATFTATQSMSIANTGANSGKYYFEVTFASGGSSGNAAVGLVPVGEGYTYQIGYNDPAANYAVGVFQNSGNVYKNGGTSAGTASAFNTIGNVLCVAYDAGNRLVWFRTGSGNWNGSASNNPATGVGGIAVGGSVAMFPAIGTDTVSSWTANFNSNFNQTIPTGFQAWYNAAPATAVAPSDVAVQFPTSGQVLQYNGSQWVNTLPGTLSGIQLPDGYISVITPSGRNKIINGSMLVTQRATASFAAGANGFAGPDRWQCINGTGTGATISQQAGGFNPGGVSSPDLAQVVSVAATSIASTAFLSGFLQNIEGQNCYDMLGSPATVSFWFYATVPGQYSVALRDYTATKSCVVPFTYTTANTPQYVKLTFPSLPTSMVVPYTTAGGMSLAFCALNTGTYQAASANTWLSGNYFTLAGNVNWAGTISNVIAITNVQFETGGQATPFERQGVQKILAECQRYYESGTQVFTCTASNTNYYTGGFHTTKRASPTMTYSGNASITSMGGTLDGFYFVYNNASPANVTLTYNASSEL